MAALLGSVGHAARGADAAAEEIFAPPDPALELPTAPTSHFEGNAEVAAPAVTSLPHLSRLATRQLAAWYAAVGTRRPGDVFGDVVGRAASQMLDQPYDYTPQRREAERLRARFDAFDCDTLVETSLALARCVWRELRQPTCFFAELQNLRYRQGVLIDYASRLHYFEDWLQDNARRGNLKLVTADLGGSFVSRPFFYLTRHLERYPALRDRTQRQAMADVEARLSRTPVAVIDPRTLHDTQAGLQTGDIVAFTGTAPGLMVRHAGIVSLDEAQTPHLVHAASLQRRVVVSAADVATYAGTRAEKGGVLVARPEAP